MQVSLQVPPFPRPALLLCDPPPPHPPPPASQDFDGESTLRCLAPVAAAVPSVPGRRSGRRPAAPVRRPGAPARTGATFPHPPSHSQDFDGESSLRCLDDAAAVPGRPRAGGPPRRPAAAPVASKSQRPRAHAAVTPAAHRAAHAAVTLAPAIMASFCVIQFDFTKVFQGLAKSCTIRRHTPLAGPSTGHACLPGLRKPCACRGW